MLLYPRPDRADVAFVIGALALCHCSVFHALRHWVSSYLIVQWIAKGSASHTVLSSVADGSSAAASPSNMAMWPRCSPTVSLRVIVEASHRSQHIHTDSHTQPFDQQEGRNGGRVVGTRQQPEHQAISNPHSFFLFHAKMPIPVNNILQGTIITSQMILSISKVILCSSFPSCSLFSNNTIKRGFMHDFIHEFHFGSVLFTV